MSANIRYATDTVWLVLKGTRIKKNDVQFHNLCKVLVARPEYKGATYSWGDQFIKLCSERTTNPGNLTTWRQVGTNHHLTLVSEQIATFPWT